MHRSNCQGGLPKTGDRVRFDRLDDPRSGRTKAVNVTGGTGAFASAGGQQTSQPGAESTAPPGGGPSRTHGGRGTGTGGGLAQTRLPPAHDLRFDAADGSALPAGGGAQAAGRDRVLSPAEAIAAQLVAIREEQLPGTDVVPVGNLRHRACECPAYAAERAFAPAIFQSAEQRNGVPACAIERGLFPSLAHEVPPPSQQGSIH